MNVNSVAQQIMSGNCTNQDLNVLADAIKFARGRLVRQVANQITRGTQVRFSGKGRSYQGEVVEIKIKNAIVNTQFGRYRVPMSMLEVI